MLLSELLDPRRFAAQQAAAASKAADGAREADQAARWAAEDAAALESALADLAELRGLAMRMARAVAAEVLAGLPDEVEADEAGVGSGDHLPLRRVASLAKPPRTRGGSEVCAAARAAEASLGRLGRTVRLTAALEKRLRAERARGVVETASAGAGRGQAGEPVKIDHPMLTPEERATLNGRLLVMVRRKQTIVGVVQEVLEADGRDEETIEDVGEVLGRRLLDWHASDTYNLPIGRMAARFLRQMKVSPVDWSRFKDRGWAVEEAAANAPGSPFGSPDIPPRGWAGGVPVPDQDTVEEEAERKAARSGSSP